MSGATEPIPTDTESSLNWMDEQTIKSQDFSMKMMAYQFETSARSQYTNVMIESINSVTDKPEKIKMPQ